MPELNYEEDIQIDCNALDVEWLQQPELMRRYSTYAARTRQLMDEAKERLDAGKAKIEMEIRKNPKDFGLDKITESAIQSTILLQDEYQELVQEYIDSKYENDIAFGAVRAVDQRKTALENLVRLLSTSYFAGPQTPRDLSHEYIKEKERKAQNTKVKMVTRRRKEGESKNKNKSNQ